MIALLMIAYALAVLIGEAIRDVRFARVDPNELDLPSVPTEIADTRWHSFSGIFLLLRRRRRLRFAMLRKIVSNVFSIFSSLLFGDFVRSFV